MIIEVWAIARKKTAELLQTMGMAFMATELTTSTCWHCCKIQEWTGQENYNPVREIEQPNNIVGNAGATEVSKPEGADVQKPPEGQQQG